MEEKKESVVEAKKVWCENNDGKSWNVKKADDEIWFVKQFANFYRHENAEGMAETGDGILRSIFKDKEYCSVVTEAAREMAAILVNKNNPSGYHLNHITSGKTSFCVFSTEGDASYKTDGVEYKDEVRAKTEAAKYEDAYTDEIKGKDGNPAWLVWIVDEESTEQMKASMPGHIVAEFDTLEDAEAEAAEHENGCVEEMPSEEWWIVVNNKTGHRVFDMLFPSETRTLAFLYKAVWPKAWAAYQKARVEMVARG